MAKNIIKKLCTKKYSKYNEITNENDVVQIDLDEFLKAPHHIRKQFKTLMIIKKQGKKNPNPGIKEILIQILGRLDNVDKRLDNVDKRLENVDKRLDNVDKRLDNVDNRLDNVEKRLDNLVKVNNLKE